jgi:O-antigen ligase
MLTNSRTGMATLVVFVFLAILSRGAKTRLLQTAVLAALIVGVGWLLLPEEQQDRMRTIWDPTINESAEASKEGRFVAFRAAMVIFERNPLTGVGPGNFMPYREACVDGIHRDPHNLIGQMLAEIGLLGTAAFAVLVTTIWVDCRRAAAAGAGVLDPSLRVLAGLARACRDSTILLFIEGISGHNLYRFNWLWLAAFCSLAANFARSARIDLDNATDGSPQLLGDTTGGPLSTSTGADPWTS